MVSIAQSWPDQAGLGMSVMRIISEHLSLITTANQSPKLLHGKRCIVLGWSELKLSEVRDD